ncbi:MAG: KaiA-binding protein, partial [Methanosarcinales archaeon]|nr:KaiA-binding protein [Methanosarcinales archaeon]
FPFPSTVLIAGESGTGKTTLCMQVLFRGAERGERGMYLMALSEPSELMFRLMSTYEFFDQRHLGTMIRYLDLSKPLEEKVDVDSLLRLIESEVMSFQPKRIVIDSLPVLETVLSKDDYRRLLFHLASLIRSWNGMTIITADSQCGAVYPADIACFTDGVILLYNMEMGSTRKRAIEILKMMGTRHRMGKHALDISDEGLVVYPGL